MAIKKTGYDLGGAEWPLDPDNLTVVDKEDPNDSNINADLYDQIHNSHLTEGDAKPEPVDWIKADFSKPGWNANLEPRPTIYIGKTLRYIDKDRLSGLALEVEEIWSHRGTLLIFDTWTVIGPFLEELIVVGAERITVKELDVISSSDEEDGYAGEWRVLLYKE